MDKQVQYVRIFACTSSTEAWYKEAAKQNLIYPVEPYFNTVFWQVVGTNKLVPKSDCEVVPHPSQQPQLSDVDYKKTIEAAQDILADYVHPESPMGEGEALNSLLSIMDDRNLVRKIKSEGVGEGQHLTKEQKDALIVASHRLRDAKYKNALSDLFRAFPDVFPPQKQVIEIIDSKGKRSYYKYEIMGLMHTSEHKSDAYVITHYEHGQELLLHLSEVFNECSYKLVPAE